jgi:major vault protein
MASERSGDLILSQGTYVLVQDGTTGQVEVVTGPFKVTLGDMDKPVVYDRETRRFTQTTPDLAIKVCPAADEGQYLVLTNPTSDEDGLRHPTKGKVSSIELKMGRKVNIQGPNTFSLFPGQLADVIDGHQLKSNEYLLIRVYNEKEALENLKNAVVKTAEGVEDKQKNKQLFDEKEIRTGNLLIIKGTDVSFYMPPTGIEVLEENDRYTRDAVTLERLEYCILLDQNGGKRYVKGPDVVFPKPTEVFIENKNQKIFRAVELNENMGIYIKVIADYTEDGRDYKAGEELFITGNEQKIYFPRAEHAIIKYGTESIHYSTALPSGEGRYILNKVTGDVGTTKGPKMLLPDPRTEVIVKRVLDDKTVELWWPGNKEALEYNRKLRDAIGDSTNDYIEENMSTTSRTVRDKKVVLASASAGFMDDELIRKMEYTKPRTIKLDTKYEGAILINVWPNYAVQIVNKAGDRRVVEGPKVIMLEYDETLETLELSTGKPKTDNVLMKTAYLQTKNNVVSDIVTVETLDLISVDIRISYRVNFEGDSKNWFKVSDYVKLLTQHMRSLIRNVVKKKTVQDFNDNATDIIRDVILGESKEGKRNGRSFEENGMKIYDVEVLNVKIGDTQIAKMLIDSQHDIVAKNLGIISQKKDLEYSKEIEEIKRKKLDETVKTLTKQSEVDLLEEENKHILLETKATNEYSRNSEKHNAEKALQAVLDEIFNEKLERDRKAEELKLTYDKERSDIHIKEVQAEMAAITPGLIEAMISSNDIKFVEILAKNLKEQKTGFTLGDLFGGESGGFDSILKAVKGSPLEDRVNKLVEDYKTFKSTKKKTTL